MFIRNRWILTFCVSAAALVSGYLVPITSAETAAFIAQPPTVVSGAGDVLGINLLILNTGLAQASNVTVTSIVLRKRKHENDDEEEDIQEDAERGRNIHLIAPSKFPVKVGNVARGVQFSVDCSFDISDVKVGAKTILVVSGKYKSGSHTSKFSVRTRLAIPSQSVISLGINKTDQLLEHAQAADGTTVDYFGTKTSSGYALALSQIFVKNSSGLNSYGFDSQGHLVTAGGADGTAFQLVWSSNTSAVATVTSADGSKHAQVSLNFSQPLGNSVAATSREQASASRGGCGRNWAIPKLSTQSAIAGVCGEGIACTQVTQCGPSDDAVVTLGYSTNLQSTTFPSVRLAAGTGIYETPLPTPGALAQGFENVCSAVKSAFGNICIVANAVLPQACFALALSPVTIEFVPPCFAIAGGLRLACLINGGGLPPGSPNLFSGFCSVVTKAIDLAEGATAILTPVAEISGSGTLAGDSISVPIGGTYPLLTVAFPPPDSGCEKKTLTGKWAGTATDLSNSSLPVNVSASVTQTDTSITAVLVYTDDSDTPNMFTETGQINGLNFSLPTTSNGTTVNVIGSFSSDGLRMSGTGSNGEQGSDSSTGNGTLTVSSDLKHISGSATTSNGNTVTWKVDKQ